MDDKVELAVVEAELPTQGAQLVGNRNRLAADGIVALDQTLRRDVAVQRSRSPQNIQNRAAKPSGSISGMNFSTIRSARPKISGATSVSEAWI
jgi:hypothetical protein